MICPILLSLSLLPPSQSWQPWSLPAGVAFILLHWPDQDFTTGFPRRNGQWPEDSLAEKGCPCLFKAPKLLLGPQSPITAPRLSSQLSLRIFPQSLKRCVRQEWRTATTTLPLVGELLQPFRWSEIYCGTTGGRRSTASVPVVGELLLSYRQELGCHRPGNTHPQRPGRYKPVKYSAQGQGGTEHAWGGKAGYGIV